MSDIATITTAITAIKVAMEIASGIRKGTVELEKAELKLKLADIIGSLADANVAIVEMQNVLIENDQELFRLREAMRIKEDVVRFGDAYYKKGDDELQTGSPYCLHCYENDLMLYSLIDVAGSIHERTCSQCKTKFSKRNCPKLE